jgi:hypothetical protein
MDQHKLLKTCSQKEPVKQIQVRSDLSAGASVQACMDNLAYWQKAYQDKCGYAAPTTY